MSSLLSFEQVSGELLDTPEKCNDPAQVELALYGSKNKSINTQYGTELTHLIYKTDVNAFKIMIVGFTPLQIKSSEARYVKPDVVKIIADLDFYITREYEKRLKEAYDPDELDDLTHRDYTEDDFEDIFLEQFMYIFAFYQDAAKNGKGVVVSMGL